MGDRVPSADVDLEDLLEGSSFWGLEQRLGMSSGLDHGSGVTVASVRNWRCVMTRSDELKKEVGAVVSDPPSLVKYFAKVAEMEQWLAGDQAKKDRLEKRWRKRYADHQKKRAAKGGV